MTEGFVFAVHIGLRTAFNNMLEISNNDSIISLLTSRGISLLVSQYVPSTGNFVQATEFFGRSSGNLKH
jgi:hypothetical protein